MKLFNIINLFRKGHEVSNPEAWKTGGNAANLLVPAIMAAVKVAGDFGLGVELDTETAIAIAAGVVAIVQFVVLNISSKRAGVLPTIPEEPGSADTPVQPPVHKPRSLVDAKRNL